MLENLFCVGLTGGIASGKSTVIGLFDQLKIHTVCADTIAKEIVTSDTALLEEISKHFGNEVIQPDGMLNRKVLRAIIFDNPSARLWLENLLHPVIRKKIKKEAMHSKSNYCVIDIPLLPKNHQYDYLDFIINLDLPIGTQVSRLVDRDKITTEIAYQMINAQPKRAERYLISDYIIQNTNNHHHLENQVTLIHEYLIKLIK